jgi:hypothetical protein
MFKVFVAKYSENSRPYNVATLHHLPDDPKNFHRTLIERVVSQHGYGTYTMIRSHYKHEGRGFKLICVVRIQHEGLSLLRTDPYHGVFEPWTGKRMWWEREGMAQRFIRAPVPSTPTSIESVIARMGEPIPRLRSNKKGWARLLEHIT